jgi:AraC family transcriptional regulator
MNRKMAPANLQTSRVVNAKNFLRAPLKSDEISVLKTGASNDPASLMALYRSEGRDEGVTSPLQQDAYLAVVVLQDLDAFTLRRNKRDIEIPCCPTGTIGFHDLRNCYSSPKYPVCSFSFVLSKAYLQELRPGHGYMATDLRESTSYLTRDDTLLHLALSMLPAFSQPNPNRLFIDQIFLAATTHLSAKFGGQPPHGMIRGRLTSRQEKIAKEYLAANIRGNVSLEYLAGLCGLSAPHFARLFKRSAGMTPYQWFIHRRLAHAKYLLETGEAPLPEIALACGFADQSHFTRTFSRIIGVSPGAWRRLDRPD